MNFAPYLQPLVEILAKTDAVFVPIRQWRGAFPAVVAQARQAYRSTGVAWRGRGDGAASRKATQLLRAEMANAGLIKLLSTRTSDKTIGVSLSSMGESIARSVIGLPQPSDALNVADRIWELRNNPDGWTDNENRQWVSEATIANADYALMDHADKRQILVILEEQLLPALVRGWVSSASDVNGRVWYSLPPALPQKPNNHFVNALTSRTRYHLPKQQKNAAKLYEREIKSALFEMETAAPTKTAELGIIPVSASPPLRRFENSTA